MTDTPQAGERRCPDCESADVVASEKYKPYWICIACEAMIHYPSDPKPESKESAGPREFNLEFSDLCYDDWDCKVTVDVGTDSRANPYEKIRVIEKSAYDKLLADYDYATTCTANAEARLHTALEEIEKLRAELAEIKRNAEAAIEIHKDQVKFVREERDEALERYRNIELANKHLTRNDHVQFGELLTKRNRYREALERIVDKINNDSNTEIYNWGAPLRAIREMAREVLGKDEG